MFFCAQSNVDICIELVRIREFDSSGGRNEHYIARWKWKSKARRADRPQAGGERSVTPAEVGSSKSPVPKAQRMGGRMENDEIGNIDGNSLLGGYIRIFCWTHVNCRLKFGYVRYLLYFCGRETIMDVWERLVIVFAQCFSWYSQQFYLSFGISFLVMYQILCLCIIGKIFFSSYILSHLL